MPSFRERVEANITVWLLSTLLVGFLAGFATYRTIQEVGGIQPIPKSRIDQLEASVIALKGERDALANRLASCQTQTKLTGTPADKELMQLRRELRTCNANLEAALHRDTVPPTRQWRHLALPGSSGDQVADRLNDIGPPPQTVVVTYDSLANTFHVWYAGAGSGARYEYGFAPASDLNTKEPTRNYFVNDGATVPAGIGRAGTDAVPLFFRVTRVH